jgi:BirA family biotin operon repressor/biotin-[acetyl-CoA-carboxylase] ligase
MRAVSFQIVLGPVETTAEIDSTNTEVLRRAAAGAANGLVLVADHQTAGRGRLDRRWEDEPGAALLVSVLLRPGLPPQRWFLLTFAAGLAAAEVAGGSLKWPNDVVVGSRKLAGILAESGTGAVVVGMGLNLRPTGVEGAISTQELGGETDRDTVLTRWLDAFDARLGRLDDLVAEYRIACSTLGRHVRVELGEESFDGVATDVTDDGHLVVADRVIAAGDVVHLRPI